MGKEKVSLIATVLNEELSIDQFLASISNLSVKPDEVVIVDGGSSDKTVDKIRNSKHEIRNIRIFLKKGANRSEGRNLAIAETKNKIIAIADAGCVLDKDWLLEISKPFKDKEVEVVSGYYQPISETVFQKCVAPFALVMPDKIDSRNFLPSARSMAIRKTVWKKFDGFPAEYGDNEDFVFANTLKNGGASIVFNQEAVVYWRPRKNLREFWTMIYRFARGDGKAGLRRFKVATIFLRYVLFIFTVLGSILFGYFREAVFFFVFLYSVWSISKNYRYVKDLRAVFILPILQVVSDIAIIAGSIEGGLNSG